MIDNRTIEWVWKGEDEDGEQVGPLVIHLPDGTSDEGNRWVRLSAAKAYAEAHGYEITHGD
jgi:hypothetical protein